VAEYSAEEIKYRPINIVKKIVNDHRKVPSQWFGEGSQNWTVFKRKPLPLFLRRRGACPLFRINSSEGARSIATRKRRVGGCGQGLEVVRSPAYGICHPKLSIMRWNGRVERVFIYNARTCSITMGPNSL
jgi:hypothetical protein